MNIEEVIKENLLLKEENDKLKNELNLTKEHLKKYTAPSSKKLYYEQNVLENKKNKYLRYSFLQVIRKIRKISMVRREIRHYTFVFLIRQSRRFRNAVP